jgi:hypothetical protein
MQNTNRDGFADWIIEDLLQVWRSLLARHQSAGVYMCCVSSKMRQGHCHCIDQKVAWWWWWCVDKCATVALNIIKAPLSLLGLPNLSYANSYDQAPKSYM